MTSTDVGLPAGCGAPLRLEGPARTVRGVPATGCDTFTAPGAPGARVTAWPWCWRARPRGYGGDRMRPVTRDAVRGSRRAVGLASEGRGEAAAPRRRDPGEPQPPTAGHPGRSTRSAARVPPCCSRPGPSGLAHRRCALDSDPPFMMVWRSVRAGGETKTRKSRRTLKLPQRCVDVLRDHHAGQQGIRHAASSRWQDNDLVFPSRVGTPADASHVRRSFRKVVAAAGLDPHEWTPRELRHSFVSLLSDAEVPIEQISRLVGHSSTTTTETIYRKQIRPVIVHGADVMDRIFPGEMNPDA